MKQPAIQDVALDVHQATLVVSMYRERSLQAWVERVLRERVELEERAFTQARRQLGAKTRRLTSR